MGHSTFSNINFSGLPANVYYNCVQLSESGTTPDLQVTNGSGNTLSLPATFIYSISGTNASGNMINFSSAGGGPSGSGFYLQNDSVYWYSGTNPYASYSDGIADGAFPSGNVYVTYAYQDNGQIFKYTCSKQTGEASGGKIYTSDDAFIWENGGPAPDPWGNFHSNVQSNYFDLTLNMRHYPYYDGRSILSVMLRATFVDPNNNAFPTSGYSMQMDNVGQTINWGDGLTNRKTITYAVPTSGTWRMVLEDHNLGVYLNGTFIDSYDFAVGHTIPNKLGSWGLFNYGPWSQYINSYTIKLDQEDNCVNIA